ncbi:MAG: hypothetical protein [Caudoviricetes sp.]|nr:MAG: hypothetical protein [Caudoviricetes sp.]
MLEFNIQVAGGSLVQINEPIGFDKVDFNLTRSETLHSISSNFAGNSIEFEFNKDVHINVFDAIIQEYDVKGFLGNVMLFITYNGNEMFKGSFDFSTTQTDMLNYLKCQIVNKDKLYLLDKNKSVAVDLLSDKDLEQNTVTPAPLDSIGLPPITLYKQSIWEDTEVKATVVNGESSFNNAQNTTKYEINDSPSWMSAVDDWNIRGAYYGRNQQLISAKENLSNLEIEIEYLSGTTFTTIGGTQSAKLMVVYGQERPDLNNLDWYNQTTKAVLLDISLTSVYNLPPITSFTISSIPRGSGVWIFWQRDIGAPLTFNNAGTKITINAQSKNYYSVNEAVFYENLVANAVKKIANIQNTQWNVNYYNATMAFNGNLLRNILDKGFEIKWSDIAKQLDERNLGAYYNEDTDTLVIDHRNNILGTNLIGTYGDLAKKDFYFVTEDENFIVNKFNYKYNKFQALKENNVNGNNASVHGESEWYIANKTFEGSIDVDLPFARDSFIIEDIRQKSIQYKEDTATNEDSTIVMMESILNDDGTSQRIKVKESITVACSYNSDNNIQSFLNDGSFNWYLIGIREGIGIEINGEYYFVEESTPTLLKTTPAFGSPTYNGNYTLDFEYVLNTNYLGKTENGLYNQDFSIRQNIQYWRNTLDTANFYCKDDIINTIYKENKEAVINGLLETQPIDYLNALHTPRIIDSKVMISVDDYFYLQNNKIGYISIYNQNNELINIYLTELKALFLNGCNMMEATLKGWLKN